MVLSHQSTGRPSAPTPIHFEPHPFHILHPLPLATTGTKNNPLPAAIYQLILYIFDPNLHY